MGKVAYQHQIARLVLQTCGGERRVVIRSEAGDLARVPPGSNLRVEDFRCLAGAQLVAVFNSVERDVQASEMRRHPPHDAHSVLIERTLGVLRFQPGGPVLDQVEEHAEIVVPICDRRSAAIAEVVSGSLEPCLTVCRDAAKITRRS